MKLSNETVLITGGAGFIGSHLSESILKMGGKVKILDDFSTGKQENLQRIHNQIEIIKGKVENYSDVDKAIADCSIVIHEAYPYGKSGMGLDEQYIEDGVLGTFNILKSSVKHDIKKVVNASSVAVYGIPKSIPIDESHKTSPFLPYGATKLAGEQYCSTFANLYGLNTVSLRYFYVYGPRYAQFDHSAMVNFLHCAIQNIPITIFGDGSQIRDYTYIDDIIDGTILATLKNETYGTVYNLSSGNCITILNLAEKIMRIVNENITIQYAQKNEYRFSDKYCKVPIGLTKREGDTWIDERDYVGNINKAKKELGYSPKTTYEEGILKTSEWIKAQLVKI